MNVLRLCSIRFLTILLTVSLTPSLLNGQSILGSKGLGLPSEPMDARGRALGSVGIGLFGGSLSPLDPASATGLLIPTVMVTLQPHWADGTLDNESVTSQGMRFPLIGVAYPIGRLRGMASVTFGGFMDQRWTAQEEITQNLNGVLTPVTNTYRSEGGIADLKFGWAQLLRPNLSVSVGIGVHTGSVTRTYLRTFDPTTLDAVEVVAFSDGGKWQYGGSTGSLGASWDPVQFLRVSGSILWSADLEAKPTSNTQGSSAKYEIPMEFRFGASGALTPSLNLNLGLSYANWSSSEGGLLPATVAGGIFSFGGGVEWQASGFGARTLPLRLGFRKADLPFRFNGGDASETVFSGGVGLNFTQASNFVLAGIDLAMERGSRDAGPLSEKFWRGSATVRVSGW